MTMREQAAPLGLRGGRSSGLACGAALEGVEGTAWPRSARARRRTGAGSTAPDAAAGQHDVEVAAEPVLVEERPLGGVGLVEPLAGGGAAPMRRPMLLLGLEDLGVGGVERGPLGRR